MLQEILRVSRYIIRTSYLFSLIDVSVILNAYHSVDADLDNRGEWWASYY